MKNKLYLLIVTILLTTIPVHAFTVSKELKSAALVFGKMSVGVIVSAIVIYFGLVFYGKIKDKINIRIKLPLGKSDKTTNNKEIFKCEIDDTKTMEEAINTFLNINN